MLTIAEHDPLAGDIYNATVEWSECGHKYFADAMTDDAWQRKVGDGCIRCSHEERKRKRHKRRLADPVWRIQQTKKALDGVISEAMIAKMASERRTEPKELRHQIRKAKEMRRHARKLNEIGVDELGWRPALWLSVQLVELLGIARFLCHETKTVVREAVDEIEDAAGVQRGQLAAWGWSIVTGVDTRPVASITRRAPTEKGEE